MESILFPPCFSPFKIAHFLVYFFYDDKFFQKETMEALSISEGRKRLFELREQIVSDHDQVILMRKGGNVVLISMDEWETNKETQRLLRDKEALKALIQSFDDHDSGKKRGQSVNKALGKLLDNDLSLKRINEPRHSTRSSD